MKRNMVLALTIMILPLLLCGCSLTKKHETEKAQKILEERYPHYNETIYIKDSVSSLYATDEIIFKLLFLNTDTALDKIVDSEIGEFVPFYSTDIRMTCSDYKIINYVVEATDKRNTKKLGIEFDVNGNIVKVYEDKRLINKEKTEKAFKEYIEKVRLNTETAISTACSKKRVIEYRPQDYI